MPRYAQLDASGVAVGVSDLSGEVDAPHMILIGGDEDFTGYTYINGEWSAPAPQPAPVKTRISKYDLIMRLTDDEANMLLADFNDAPGKLSLLWNSINYVDLNDPYYLILQGIVVNRLGSTRAAEVLAPME